MGVDHKMIWNYLEQEEFMDEGSQNFILSRSLII